mgnify:CR=1 FL=1
MAFTTTSDSIIIKASLTEKGKKLLARGNFKIAKFALGDDEVDYRLYNAVEASTAGYVPALKNARLIESLKDGNSNIQFGLNSYDDGVLYLTIDEIESLEDDTPHAYMTHLPVLVKNTKTNYAPTTRDEKYYLSVNDETTQLIRQNIKGFNFLEVNDFDKTKIIIESGINNTGTDDEHLTPTPSNREQMILKKFLLDEDFMVQADNRLISGIVGIQQTSQFENFESGESIINFNTSLSTSPAISLDANFEYFANYLTKGIANLMMDIDLSTEIVVEDLMSIDPVSCGLTKSTSANFSNLKGPKGSIVAFNPLMDPQLQTNSTGARDERYSQFGTLESAIFSEMPTRKFDYIDTTIYIVGTATNSTLQVPLRIVRYVGT